MMLIMMDDGVASWGDVGSLTLCYYGGAVGGHLGSSTIKTRLHLSEGKFMSCSLLHFNVLECGIQLTLFRVDFDLLAT